MAKKITVVHSSYDIMLIGPSEEEVTYTRNPVERNMHVRRWMVKSKKI